jgi:hypothetical protein
MIILRFFHGDGAGFAHFHARFTAKTFFGVHGNGLAVLKLVHFNRAHVHALAVAGTFVVIDGNIPGHFVLQSLGFFT